MKFLNRLAWIFASPTRVFDDIRENRVRWVEPWLMVSVLTMLTTWLGLPIQRALLEINAGNLSAEQADRQLEIVTRFGFVQVLLTPLGVLMLSLVVAALSYVLVTVLSRQATFKQYFTLTLFTSVVSSLGQVLSSTILRLRGLDAIQSAEDARFSLSLRALAPEHGAALKGLLGSFEFFVIWSMVLLVMGLMRVFGMSRASSIIAIIPLWLIYVAVLILTERFGGMG